jgi:hypothetical protein
MMTRRKGLLSLPEPLKSALSAYTVTEEQARAISEAPAEEIPRLIDYASGTTVGAVKDEVDRVMGRDKPQPPAPEGEPSQGSGTVDETPEAPAESGSEPVTVDAVADASAKIKKCLSLMAETLHPGANARILKSIKGISFSTMSTEDLGTFSKLLAGFVAQLGGNPEPVEADPRQSELTEDGTFKRNGVEYYADGTPAVRDAAGTLIPNEDPEPVEGSGLAAALLS